MNDLPASTIKRTLIYLNLLSFVTPERAGEVSPVGELPPLRGDFGEGWPGAVEKAAWLVVSFQSASRNPDGELVAGLADAARGADSSPEACRAFQAKMDALAQLPGRAKESNRLHRKKGCRFCESPCRYGYFSLISEPDFKELQHALEAENSKPLAERQPIQAVWHFTLEHLSQAIDIGQIPIAANHLGNLAYCMVALATIKSRFAFPEEQMRKFQDLNQAMIRYAK